MRVVARLAVLLGALALPLGACGGNQEEAFKASVIADPGPVHVHALGIDPMDGTLFVATHTGLFRLEEGQAKAQRVADRYQDTMGFTVVGGGHFLGSGHPDLKEAREQGLPPLLGLIESRDSGESWSPISLLGDADFHVLRLSGDRVYGYDATGVRLMVSDDRGVTWRRQAVPGELLDLVVNPTARDHLVATTERGLYESLDGGTRWTRIFEAPGLLAWPARDRLYLAVSGGLVFASADAGRSWEQVGSLGGEPAALLALNGTELYAALHDGTITRSTDAGASWIVRSTP